MIEVGFAKKKDGTEMAVIKFQYWIPSDKFVSLASTFTDVEKELSDIVRNKEVDK